MLRLVTTSVPSAGLAGSPRPRWPERVGHGNIPGRGLGIDGSEDLYRSKLGALAASLGINCLVTLERALKYLEIYFPSGLTPSFFSPETTELKLTCKNSRDSKSEYFIRNLVFY